MSIDLKTFSKENLPNVLIEELANLTKEDISLLAKEYFYVEPILLIQKTDGSGVSSPATWKSLFSLLKLGMQFKIVGLLNIKPKSKPQKDTITPIIETIAQVEFLAPEKPIIVSEEAPTPKKGGRPRKNNI